MKAVLHSLRLLCMCLCGLLALGAPTAASEREEGSTSALLREQLGARVERALSQGRQHELRFEVVEISHWQLSRDDAEFVLWGLLHSSNAPARMLRVESRINRRSLQLGELDLQAFDELQALQLAPLR